MLAKYLNLKPNASPRMAAADNSIKNTVESWFDLDAFIRIYPYRTTYKVYFTNFELTEGTDNFVNNPAKGWLCT